MQLYQRARIRVRLNIRYVANIVRGVPAGRHRETE